MRESRTYESGRGACHEISTSATSSHSSAARRLAWPLTARAQQAARIPRIGYLSPGSASGGFQGRDEAFRQALRDLGYVESSTIAIQYRFAEGRFDRLPELAAELVRLNVDVIVAVVTQASLAAKDATNSIPIVMVADSIP